MANLVGISGSLRRGSFNTMLLHAAARHLPQGVALNIRTLHGIPLYDADLEVADGIPPSVSALKEVIAAADGVILATPEYNNGIPGVFKNAIDWTTRPAADIKRLFAGKSIALMGASPGGFGTILSQNAWLPILRTLGAEPWFGGRLFLSRAQTLFDSSGNLTDAAIQEQLLHFMQGFVEFVQRCNRLR
jgi:chromate reductase, NAD(P)H dehydrogenase (quinone)